MTERQQLWAGLGLIVLGIVVAVVGGFLVHTSEAPEVNAFGQPIYEGFPRGWLPALIAQMISLGGVLMSMGGVLLAFVYGKTLTWSRAMIGGLLFTGLDRCQMIVAFIYFGEIMFQKANMCLQQFAGIEQDSIFAVKANVILVKEPMDQFDLFANCQYVRMIITEIF